MSKKQNGLLTFIFIGHNRQTRSQATSLLRFLDHTQLHTHTHTHTHKRTRPVGLLWTSDQLVAETATYRAHNKHNSLREIRTRNPCSRADGDLNLRPHDHRDRLAQFYWYCFTASAHREYGYHEGVLYCGYVTKWHLFCDDVFEL